MLLGSESIGSTPIASSDLTLLLGASETGTGVDLNILKDRASVVFYVEIIAKQNSFVPPEIQDEMPIAGQPVAAYSPTGFSGFNAPEEVFRFSDVTYYPKSTDPLRPNKIPFAALVNPSDVDRTISVALEAESRGQTSFGEIEIANPSGRFDDIFRDYNPDKRLIKIWAGSRYSDFTKFFQVGAAVASGPWYQTQDKIVIPVVAQPIGLDASFSVGTYSGLGGVSGDSNLVARKKPILFGKNVYNTTPVLINLANYIYQVSGTPINGVSEVKDQGLDLTGPFADYPTFDELRDAPIPSGNFATCKALGIFRANFAGGSPEGVVTCVADGVTDEGLLLANTSEVIEYTMINIAGFPESSIDLASVRELPGGQIGYYYDGSTEFTVEQFLSEILRPINGYFITDRKNKFSFSTHTDPDIIEPVASFNQGIGTENDIISIEQEENDVDPIFNLQYDYSRNYTPLVDDQISDAVSPEDKIRLKSQFLSTSVSDPTLQFTDASAKSLLVETHFTDEISALSIATKQLAVRTKRRAKHILVVRYKGLIVNPGDVITVKHPRFSPSGKRFLVFRVVDRLDQGNVELGIYG